MEIFRAVNVAWRSDLLTPLFWLLSYTGLSQIQVLFTLFFYSRPSTRRFIVPCLTTLLFSGLILVHTFKRLLPRDRPSMLEIALPQEDFRHSSFISGHTTTAFALATMLTLMTVGSRRPWIGALAMIWAFGVGLSRIYRGVHWPSDTLAGACAGAFGSAMVYLVFSRKGWLDLKLERTVKLHPQSEQ